ncbi:MAG: hypothetical protein LUD17_08735 [Bacteroidales bacterium]|nr:hypothetical protein [Bacteroidales bacterium]
MVRKNDILLYANNNVQFSYRDLYSYFDSQGIEYQRSSILTRLKRLVCDGVLKRVGTGVLSLADTVLPSFQPVFTTEMEQIEKLLHHAFPLLDICIWHIDDIKSMSHYFVNLDIIYIETERDSVESVFNFLNECITDRKVFISPSKEDYQHYIIGEPSIVVRPLMSQAPVKKYGDKSLRSSLEKLLVEAVCDDDFEVWHGYQALRLYDTAMDRYSVNLPRLMRYASRRNRKEEISKIIENRHNIYQ